jgi:hypothetical protein
MKSRFKTIFTKFGSSKANPITAPALKPRTLEDTAKAIHGRKPIRTLLSIFIPP